MMMRLCEESITPPARLALINVFMPRDGVLAACLLACLLARSRANPELYSLRLPPIDTDKSDKATAKTRLAVSQSG